MTTTKADHYLDSIFNPLTIGIIGVSEKENSFGKKILENLLQSNIQKNNLLVIKHNHETFQGIKCCPDISYLKENPIDALILVLPSLITVATITQLTEQGGGANVVYIVAGGIGDGADKYHLADDITEIIEKKRKLGLWTPRIIGPNCLGIINSPLNLTTLFISNSRVKINFNPKGKIALFSQSGAFLLTLLSYNPSLSLKYGVCIGNQMDIKIIDLIDHIKDDLDISTIAIYLEQLDEEDTNSYINLAKKINKKIVLYIGGKSSEGKTAIKCHTGSKNDNYVKSVTILQDSGIIIPKKINEFYNKIYWQSFYPNYTDSMKVSVISNAGYETVASADLIGTSETSTNMLYQLTQDDCSKLKKSIRKNKLHHLVSINNPLDVTPVATETVYIDCLKCLSSSNTDIIAISLTPYTDSLSVFDKEVTLSFAKEILLISRQENKLIAIIIDGGPVYEPYRHIYTEAGNIVFDSVESFASSL